MGNNYFKVFKISAFATIVPMKRVLIITVFLLISVGMFALKKESTPQSRSSHIKLTFRDCDRPLLEDRRHLQFILIDAAKAAGAQTIDGCETRSLLDNYTLVLLLDKSYASLTALKEEGSCFIDMAIINDELDPKIFQATIEEHFHSKCGIA